MWTCECGKTEKKWVDEIIKVFCPVCKTELKQDNQTSLESFISVKSDVDSLNESYNNIINAYKKFGDLTDGELTKHLGFKDKNSVRPRRFELVNDLELVKHVASRECSVSRKTCKSWGLV